MLIYPPLVSVTVPNVTNCLIEIALPMKLFCRMSSPLTNLTIPEIDFQTNMKRFSGMGIPLILEALDSANSGLEDAVHLARYFPADPMYQPSTQFELDYSYLNDFPWTTMTRNRRERRDQRTI